MVLVLLVFLAGCSTQESKNNFDTALCFLRPSCLPSQPSSTHTNPPPQVQPLSETPTSKPQSPPCHTTAKMTITAQNPSITVSYKEPTTRVDGTPLTNLAKTTIYQNQGSGFIRTKEVPATNSKGGGQISETLLIQLGPDKSIDTTICVTATNSHGQEG